MTRTVTNIESQTSLRAVVIAANTTLSAQSHAHRPVVVTAATGVAITLPAATGSGDRYNLQLGATITSNSTTIKVNGTPGTDIIQGGVVADQDSTDAPDMVATAGDTDTITFDGTTKGGYIGDWIELVDSAEGTWLLRGVLKRTGTEASPFSATVS